MRIQSMVQIMTLAIEASGSQYLEPQEAAAGFEPLTFDVSYMNVAENDEFKCKAVLGI